MMILRFPEDCWLQLGEHVTSNIAIATIRSRTNLISFPHLENDVILQAIAH
jgi:hypothetical protein